MSRWARCGAPNAHEALTRAGGRTPQVGYHQADPAEALTSLLSAERLRTYEYQAPQWGCGPMQLYLLGVELAASLHADLALLEICLRNSMDRELTMSYGKFWFTTHPLLDERSQAAVVKAWADAESRPSDPPGKTLARLPMGFWVHLLEAGGYIGRPPYRERRNYDELLWKPALHRAFPGTSQRRSDVQNRLHLLYALRNRIAHHEPIVQGVRRPGVPRSAQDAYVGLRELHGDLITTMHWISPEVGAWLTKHSRTPSLLDHDSAARIPPS